jgi:hypothetical protein
LRVAGLKRVRKRKASCESPRRSRVPLMNVGTLLEEEYLPKLYENENQVQIIIYNSVKIVPFK